MITLGSQIFASLGLPLDTRELNAWIDEGNVVVETEVEYLERIDINSRWLGMPIVFLGMTPGVYTIQAFMDAIQNGTTGYLNRTFVGNTSDSSLKTITSSGSGHTITDINDVAYTDQPILQFDGCKVEDVLDDENQPVGKTRVTAATTEEHISFGVGDVGAIKEGDPIPSYTTMDLLVKQIFQALVPPTPPSASLNLSVSPINSLTQEIGSTVNVTLDPKFTTNDAGDITTVVLKKGSTELITQGDLSDYVHSNQLITSGTSGNSYNSTVNYEEGPEDPLKEGTIPAGSKYSTRSINGVYKSWFGSTGETPPINGTELRNLSSSSSNSFTLNTGSPADPANPVADVLVIAIPSTKTLTSVIDLDALNAELVDSYILNNTITQMPDASGTLYNCKVYELTLATEYSSNHRHIITIS